MGFSSLHLATFRDASLTLQLAVPGVTAQMSRPGKEEMLLLPGLFLPTMKSDPIGQNGITCTRLTQLPTKAMGIRRWLNAPSWV